MTARDTLDSILAIEDLFSEEEKAARDTVRRWVRKRFTPVIRDCHREGRFPQELIAEIAALGALGSTINGYGCAGMNSVAYGLVLQEMERGDAGLRSFCSVQSSLVMYPILAFGSDEQRDRWLPALAAGKVVGCFGLTEPSAGSDPAAMTTTATKYGDTYVLDGIKSWITNAPIADLAVVWAKVTNEDNRIRGFLVERGREGFETPSIEGKFSLRASSTGELLLNDCRVPAANLLPHSEGLKSALSCLTEAREGIGWGVTGAAADCFDTALDYGLNRVAFGRPIAATQLYQAQLADMAALIVSSQLLSLHCGRLKDQGRLTHLQVSLHKRQNVSAAREITRMARSMLGAIGITDAHPVMRHMLNMESVATYEGTHEVHTLTLGRALTGHDAFGADW